MEQIELLGMEFYSYIGHYNEEKQIGNYFTVDLVINTDCKKAGISDNLNDALDYQEIYKIVKIEMRVKCNLLENVCKRILDKIYEYNSKIENIEIKVAKLNPTLGGKINNVAVRMKKNRKKSELHLE